MMQDNLFQKIIDRKIPADIVHEDDRCLAFRDVNPQAPVHVLIIPRKVIPTHADVTEADRDLLGHLHLVAARLAEQLGTQDGYRLVLNCNERSGQTAPPLPLRLLAARVHSFCRSSSSMASTWGVCSGAGRVALESPLRAFCSWSNASGARAG